MAEKTIKWAKCKYCGAILTESDFLYHTLSEHFEEFPRSLFYNLREKEISSNA